MTTDQNAMMANVATPLPAVSARTTFAVRMFGWGMLGVLAAFLVNNYLTYWLEWPGPTAVLAGGKAGIPALALVQAGLYGLSVVLAFLYVRGTGGLTLRQDSARASSINAFLIRCAFFAVLYIGVVDAVLSFMRVEGMLPAVFGDHFAIELGKSQFRGPWVHMPLTAVAIVTAIFSRTLGFTWLALLIVVAELGIVISRFIFSYEQGFMGDLVRFWYAALFLFASAYTLIEEGHVRVDVFYAAFSPKRRGLVNALGSIFLGMTLCWIILAVGLGGPNAVINSSLLAWETTQSGFSMYVKYMMAGFLAVFAVSMMIQFVSYMMDAIADVRSEPGGRDHSSHSVA